MSRMPGDTLPDHEPGYLIVTDHTRMVAPWDAELQFIAQRGVEVTLLSRRGALPPSLAGHVSHHRLAQPPAVGPLLRLRRWGDRSARRVGRPASPEESDFARRLRSDPVFHALAARCHIVPIGAAASEAVVQQVAVLGEQPLPTRRLTEHYLELVFGHFIATVHSGKTPTSRGGARLLAAISRWRDSPEVRPRLDAPAVLSAASSVLSTGWYDIGIPLAQHLLERSAIGGQREQAELRAQLALAELTAFGETREDPVTISVELMRAADEAVAVDDPDAAAEHLTTVLQLLFHRELHADSPTSPLVEDPAAFLRPLHNSMLWSLLHAPGSAGGQGNDDGGLQVADRAEGPRRIVVLPGTYGRFIKPVLDTLRDDAAVDVVDVTWKPAMRGLGVHQPLVADLVRQAMGYDIEPDYQLVNALSRADTVFIDWADRGALAAMLAAPPAKHIVLRIHSMDALSSWLHLLDWSRIDDVIFVSAHVRDVVTHSLGPLLGHTRTHIIPNVIDLDRLSSPPVAGRERVLGMVGWAQRVKDPLWTLEVLAMLRSTDCSWRLRLVGHDFAPGQVSSAHRYAQAFRARLAEEDVAGAVDVVPYTQDVSVQLAKIGFIISSSIRESFHQGLVEGVTAGAMPIVRDWPLFKQIGGARQLFPQSWVVDDIEEAAGRIRSLASPDEWHVASTSARRLAHSMFSQRQSRELVRSVLLGH